MRVLLHLPLLLLPCAAFAQTQNCDLIESRQTYSVAGGEVTYLGGPVFKCDNGMRIVADSGVVVNSTLRFDFMGNVRFSDPTRSLTSQYAQYVGRERRLMAQGNVVLTDLRDGSTLRAPAIDYFQKGGSNPEDRVEVYSGRPHATIYRRRQPQAAVQDTTDVYSDAMTIIGQQTFRGRGNVVTRRGKMSTNSDYAEFDQAGNFMRLYGKARVESDTFKLSADSIDAELVNGDEFKSVHARRDARLDSEQVDVTAPRLLISFDQGDIERLVAIGGKRISDSAAQAHTVSKDFTLTADSIDALSPQQKLEKVIAIGAALGEREPDSLDAKLPELIRKDWVRGDTVQAFFGQAKADTARVLQRILALGTPAASTYKLHQNKNDSTEVSINYLTARQIDVQFKDGEVDQVLAEGDIHGLYLQRPDGATAASNVTVKRR